VVVDEKSIDAAVSARSAQAKAAAGAHDLAADAGQPAAKRAVRPHAVDGDPAHAAPAKPAARDHQARPEAAQAHKRPARKPVPEQGNVLF
jgi:hypothetical protein